MVRNAGGTILGADNKASVAAMLEATARVLDNGRPHAGIELLFTPKEEVGLRGAAAFDVERLRARVGYVYDHAAPGRRGDRRRAAHAQARRRLPRPRRARGHVSGGRTLRDRGRSEGGRRPAARPDRRRDDCERRRHRGRHRPQRHSRALPSARRGAEPRRAQAAEVVQEMLEPFTFAAGLAECEVEVQLEELLAATASAATTWPFALAATALERSGREPSFVLSGGGADANVFNERGLQCVNLANGDDRHPHARRADRGLRPRGDGRRHARAGRRGARGGRCRLASGAAA